MIILPLTTNTPPIQDSFQEWIQLFYELNTGQHFFLGLGVFYSLKSEIVSKYEIHSIGSEILLFLSYFHSLWGEGSLIFLLCYI